MKDQNKYNEFWKWFIDNSELLFNFENNQENLFDSLSDELHKIDEYLTFEFGPIENNKREFIISADGIIDSFPEVENLYNQKPEFKEWEIIKFRPRKSCNFEIKIDDITLSPQDVYYKLFKDETKIGILLFIEKYNENTELYAQMTFLLLDAIIGEYDMETKVGALEIMDFNSEYFPDSLPLKTLSENFDMVYNKTERE